MDIIPAFLKRVQWNPNFVPGGVEKFWTLTAEVKPTMERQENPQTFFSRNPRETSTTEFPFNQDDLNFNCGRNCISNLGMSSDQHTFLKPFNLTEPFR